MRKIVALSLSFFVFSFFLSAQTIIENPKKPLSKNAGRVIKLQEIFRITDESGDFYFKAPMNLKVNSKGNFFILDENQILKFSSNGKFLNNLYKKGQGPGEISTRFHSMLRYFLLKNEIFFYDSNGNKIIHMDGDGNLIEEIKLEITRLNELYGFVNEGFIFIDEAPGKKGVTGFHELDMSIIWISRDGTSDKKIMAFPKKVYWGKTASGMFGKDWARFYSVLDSETWQLFVSHTCEYQIVLAELKKGQVIKTFSRKYHRVKYVMPEAEKQFHEKFNINPPERKFENDILGLFLNKGRLWVRTSTTDKKKGVLIDVFNKEGKYTDNFFLKINGSLMTVHGDYIFVQEKDEDENIQIVQYRIIE